jgi:hypothetical protein
LSILFDGTDSDKIIKHGSKFEELDSGTDQLTTVENLI